MVTCHKIKHKYSEKGGEGLPLIEAEDGLCRVVGNKLRKSDDVSVESSSHELEVREYECLVGVKSHGNDVLAIRSRIANNIFHSYFLFEEELLVCSLLWLAITPNWNGNNTNHP